MIIRELKHTPSLIENFDWFNDYKDTRNWAIHNMPKIVHSLDKGYYEWLNGLYKLSGRGK